MAKLRSRDGLAELQSGVWLLHATLDPVETLLRCGPTIVVNRFARYRFCPEKPPESLKPHELAFRWVHEGDGLLPSMHGTIAARRIGPLLRITVHVRYSCGLELPERLFFEAIGSRLADRAFSALRRGLVRMLQHRFDS
jgi:hypothetical protein